MTELDQILAAWVRDVDSEPFPELVDVPTAIALLRAARQNGTP